MDIYCAWDGLAGVFIFVCLGHSRVKGLRVTDVVSWILCGIGIETDNEKLHNLLNYEDDPGDV